MNFSGIFYLTRVDKRLQDVTISVEPQEVRLNMIVRFPIILHAFSACALALVLGCSGATINDPPLTDPFELSITTASGGIINQGEALILNVTGLQSGEYPVIAQVLDSQSAVVSQARLTASSNGRINNFILSYDLGFFDTSGDGRLAPGNYTVRVNATAGTITGNISVPAAPDGPMVWGCDIDGNLSNAFLAGEPVFFSAESLTPNTVYRAWPVDDRRAWNDGDIIKSWQADAPSIIWPIEIPEYVEVTTDANGDVDPTQLLPYATKLLVGITDQFDIVIDAEPFAVFNVDTDAVDGQIPTGVVVQEELPDGPLYAELASYSNYTYSNEFKVGEEVNIWLNPGFRLNDFSMYVLKYILYHTELWADGTPLEDITGGAELDAIQIGCINEGLVLAWIIDQIGEYDVLLDVNGNGIYDEGIDILDGGPDGPGFTVTD